MPLDWVWLSDAYYAAGCSHSGCERRNRAAGGREIRGTTFRDVSIVRARTKGRARSRRAISSSRISPRGAGLSLRIRLDASGETWLWHQPVRWHALKRLYKGEAREPVPNSFPSKAESAFKPAPAGRLDRQRRPDRRHAVSEAGSADAPARTMIHPDYGKKTAWLPGWARDDRLRFENGRPDRRISGPGRDLVLTRTMKGQGFPRLRHAAAGSVRVTSSVHLRPGRVRGHHFGGSTAALGSQNSTGTSASPDGKWLLFQRYFGRRLLRGARRQTRRSHIAAHGWNHRIERAHQRAAALGQPQHSLDALTLPSG